LNIISGRTEAIQKRLPPDHPLTRHASTILRQVERISGIIHQLLDYARPRRPALSAVAVQPMLSRVVDLLEPVARNRQVRLIVEASPKTAPLLADPDQLQQVLLNLVTNALDATPPAGQVRLVAGDDALLPRTTGVDARPCIRRGEAATPCVTLQVEDTGCGIATDRLEKIFEPFFSTKERRGGTGLGLPIVEDIVRAHRGAIEIESAEGRGTTIRLRWPAVAAEGAAAGDSERMGTASAPTGDA
jgi:signal transduction histidine kinase